MIIGPQNTNLGQNMYMVEVSCDEFYPFRPPRIRFQTRINMDGVNPNNGDVDAKKFDILKNWNKKYRIQHVLCRLRDAMVCVFVYL